MGEADGVEGPVELAPAAGLRVGGEGRSSAAYTLGRGANLMRWGGELDRSWGERCRVRRQGTAPSYRAWAAAADMRVLIKALTMASSSESSSAASSESGAWSWSGWSGAAAEGAGAELAEGVLWLLLSWDVVEGAR